MPNDLEFYACVCACLPLICLVSRSFTIRRTFGDKELTYKYLHLFTFTCQSGEIKWAVKI